MSRLIQTQNKSEKSLYYTVSWSQTVVSYHPYVLKTCTSNVVSYLVTNSLAEGVGGLCLQYYIYSLCSTYFKSQQVRIVITLTSTLVVPFGTVSLSPLYYINIIKPFSLLKCYLQFVFLSISWWELVMHDHNYSHH